MKYRAEIDGLRALAVVPVILFHAGFEWFSGGFVGVDVFFVISGYLITTILIEDIENGRFSIVKFYERRARRILPALFFVVLCCIPFAWIWMLPSQFEDFSQSLIGVSLFSSNILFWLESGYFESAAEQKPLLHTWSLAVEEQYYVLFPVFLILAWRFGKQRVFWIIVVLAAISFSLSELGSRRFESANFYLAPTRAWELFAGSITAFIVQKRGVSKNNALSMLGLGLIAFSILAYNESTPFPGAYAIVPVLGVVLLVLFAGRETFAAKMLSTKLVVGIGLISYSAYLWHQPLFAFARINQINDPGVLQMLALGLASFVFAYLSWKHVEAPFRNRKFLSTRQVLSLSVVVLISGVCVGLFGHFKHDELGVGELNPLNQPIDIGKYTNDNTPLQLESWSLLRKLSDDAGGIVDEKFLSNEDWFDDDDPRRRLLLIGNSHSKDLFNIFVHSKVVSEQFRIARYGVQIRDLDERHELFESTEFSGVDVVVIASRYRENDLQNLERILRKLQGLKKQVVVIENIFEFREFRNRSWNLIDKLVYEDYLDGVDAENISKNVNASYYAEYLRGQTSDSVTNTNIELRHITGQFPGIRVLDRMDYICDRESEVCFAVSDELEKNFFDYGHHTLSGSVFFGQRVDEINWFDFD